MRTSSTNEAPTYLRSVVEGEFAFTLSEAFEGASVGRMWRKTLIAGTAGLAGACTPPAPVEGDYANITDPTNRGAKFVGSASCVQCHAGVAAIHQQSAHANALTPVLGDGPAYSPGDAIAGVSAPPAGLSWRDVSWVLGGFRKGALLLGVDGYFLTTGVSGVATQFNLSFPPNGTPAGYVEFQSDRVDPLPFEFATFRRVTTGAAAQDAAAAEFFEGRVGIQGTWSEAGVACEACHGPGGGHFSAEGSDVRIDRGAIFVDPDGSATCKSCHSGSFDSNDRQIRTIDGFVAPFQQANELLASGAHASFSCGTCHESHQSSSVDRSAAIRNECRACHADVNMALHDGAVFRRQDGYAEVLSCESCHMSYGVKRFSSAGFGLGGAGDTRTHLFGISTQPQTFAAATDEAGNLRLDGDGRAGMTVDRVCLRCHNDAVDGLFSLTVARAAEIGPNLHLNFSP
ncbi:MAG: cytochrome c3 family protein [Phycisphaerae bacterium]|nr:cytochrome c3 family protein [Phycisphaerae bacterium]